MTHKLTVTNRIYVKLEPNSALVCVCACVCVCSATDIQCHARNSSFCVTCTMLLQQSTKQVRSAAGCRKKRGARTPMQTQAASALESCSAFAFAWRRWMLLGAASCHGHCSWNGCVELRTPMLGTCRRKRRCPQSSPHRAETHWNATRIPRGNCPMYGK